MTIEFHPHTASDLNNAKAHYNQKRPGLAIDRISDNPRQYQIIERDIRRCLIHRFHYSIYFKIIGTQTIRILVIRHHKRHPRYGLRRG